MSLQQISFVLITNIVQKILLHQISLKQMQLDQTSFHKMGLKEMSFEHVWFKQISQEEISLQQMLKTCYEVNATRANVIRTNAL